MGFLRQLVEESAKQLLNEVNAKLEKEAAKANAKASSSHYATTTATAVPNLIRDDGNSGQPRPKPNSGAPEDQMTQAQKNQLSNMRVQMMDAQARRALEGADRMGCSGTNTHIVYVNRDNSFGSI
ncbi:hypothetical protein vseg_020814 [Gypsophila vaccaria]